MTPPPPPPTAPAATPAPATGSLTLTHISTSGDRDGGVAATFRIVCVEDDDEVSGTESLEITDIIMTNPGSGYTTSDTLILTYSFGTTAVTSPPSVFQVASNNFPTSSQTIGTTGLVFTINAGAGRIKNVAPANNSLLPTVSQSSWFKDCKLRCHYIHVTGPEATALMNREHVRLMKLMDDTNHQQKQFTISCGPKGVIASSRRSR